MLVINFNNDPTTIVVGFKVFGQAFFNMCRKEVRAAIADFCEAKALTSLWVWAKPKNFTN